MVMAILSFALTIKHIISISEYMDKLQREYEQKMRQVLGTSEQTSMSQEIEMNYLNVEKQN